MRRSWLSAGLSLGVALCLAGCGDSGKSGFSEYKESPKGKPAAPHSHGEHEHGPNGGHIVELGGEDYHGEVCFDQESKKVTVYLLKEDVKTALPIDAKEITLSLMIEGKPQPFVLKAAPKEGEPDGKSSRFELGGDLTIASSIKDEEDLEGNLSVKIDGKAHSGKIVHDHDHHDHGKEKKDGDHKDEHKEGEKKEAAAGAK